MTVYAWWFMFIGWLLHPLDTTVLGCIPAYLPTRKIIDAFSYLLPRCPFERQERAKMLQKFKQHIDGISGPLEQHFTQHHLFHWKSSNLNLLGDDEEIGSKLNEESDLCCKPKLYVCFNMHLQLNMGSSKNPQKNLPGFSRLPPFPPPPEVKVKQHKRRLRRWKSRCCEEMPPFEEKKKVSRCWRCWGRICWAGRFMLFFWGEKRDEGLLNCWNLLGRMHEWHVSNEKTLVGWVI